MTTNQTAHSKSCGLSEAVIGGNAHVLLLRLWKTVVALYDKFIFEEILDDSPKTHTGMFITILYAPTVAK